MYYNTRSFILHRNRRDIYELRILKRSMSEMRNAESLSASMTEL